MFSQYHEEETFNTRKKECLFHNDMTICWKFNNFKSQCIIYSVYCPQNWFSWHCTQHYFWCEASHWLTAITPSLFFQQGSSCGVDAHVWSDYYLTQMFTNSVAVNFQLRSAIKNFKPPAITGMKFTVQLGFLSSEQINALTCYWRNILHVFCNFISANSLPHLYFFLSHTIIGRLSYQAPLTKPLIYSWMSSFCSHSRHQCLCLAPPFSWKPYVNIASEI